MRIGKINFLPADQNDYPEALGFMQNCPPVYPYPVGRKEQNGSIHYGFWNSFIDSQSRGFLAPDNHRDASGLPISPPLRGVRYRPRRYRAGQNK